MKFENIENLERKRERILKCDIGSERIDLLAIASIASIRVALIYNNTRTELDRLV